MAVLVSPSPSPGLGANRSPLVQPLLFALQLHSIFATQFDSTQLVYGTLRGLHFGASWPPKSTQDRPKSPLDASFLQKREFSRNIGRRSVWGLSQVPKTTQDRPKTAPRRSSRSAFFDLVFIFDFGPSWVRFGLHLGSILAPFWVSKFAQVPRVGPPCEA